MTSQDTRFSSKPSDIEPVSVMVGIDLHQWRGFNDIM